MTTDQTALQSDLLVLGGGSGGYAAALRGAQLGLSVTLVERSLLGGTCLHRGCIPTKALLHVAEVADAARHGASIGVHAPIEKIDMAAVHAFKEDVVARLHRGLTGLVDHAGITVVAGHGTVVGDRAVEVDGVRYVGGALVVATGSTARRVPRWEIGPEVVTSDEALALDQVPDRAVVIGGSVIGVEFASLWRSLGSTVTVVEAQERLVPAEEPVISKQLQRAFRRRGIVTHLGASVTSVERTAGGVLVTLANGKSAVGDVVLVAVGRGPASAGTGLREAGVTLADDGWVEVDENLETAVPGVFAVGDLVRGPQLAHRGFAHGIFVAERIAGEEPVLLADHLVPRVTYCDPEIASVGLGEAEARELHGDVQVQEYNLAGNGRSQILGSGGIVKIVRRAGGAVLGVHAIGARIGEQVGEAALLVGTAQVPEEISHLVHAHPTQNEALGEALLAIAGKPLHAHG